MNRSSLPQPSQVIYEDRYIRAGQFTIAPEHPDFAHAGSMTHPTLVFPRYPVAIQLEDQPLFAADQHRITLYNKGQKYRRQALGRSGDQCDWVEFLPAYFQAFRATQRLSPDAPFKLAYLDTSTAQFLTERRIFNQLQQANPPSGSEVLSFFQPLISTAVTQPCDERQHLDLVEAVRCLIGQRFTENDSIEAFARTLGVSTFHLCRVFKQMTRTTLHQYRNQLRLYYGADRLKTGIGLADLALELGFSSHSHFSTAFLQLFGMSPRDMRKLYASTA